MSFTNADMSTLASALLHQDRASLARAITLVESTRADHQEQAQALLTELLPHTGKSIRIGITGVPGVGKSTFIEAFGLHVIEQGHKVAVLAIDPSSSISGGSILGDKTRMTRLSQAPNAYIRPSPTAGSLGGVARRTREAMLLCEAAGYGVIIVETVGVGQSEIEVANMTDMFMLLLLPGSGDELQGIKKGIVELADLLIVNKADGELAVQAKRVQADYKAAVRILHQQAEWQPQVLTCSALEGKGMSEIWQQAQLFMQTMQQSGAFAHKRAGQSVQWMWREINDRLKDAFMQHAYVQNHLASIEQQVSTQTMPPLIAAEQLMQHFLGKE